MSFGCYCYSVGLSFQRITFVVLRLNALPFSFYYNIIRCCVHVSDWVVCVGIGFGLKCVVFGAIAYLMAALLKWLSVHTADYRLRPNSTQSAVSPAFLMVTERARACMRTLAGLARTSKRANERRSRSTLYVFGVSVCMVFGSCDVCVCFPNRKWKNNMKRVQRQIELKSGWRKTFTRRIQCNVVTVRLLLVRAPNFGS